jgi:hypothetical protein
LTPSATESITIVSWLECFKKAARYSNPNGGNAPALAIIFENTWGGYNPFKSKLLQQKTHHGRLVFLKLLILQQTLERLESYLCYIFYTSFMQFAKLRSHGFYNDFA